MTGKHRWEVLWTREAEKDLRNVWRYYAREASRKIANQLIQEILETGESLSHRALTGRPRNEVSLGLRSVLSKPYVIFYCVNDANVEVMRVLHERRDFTAIFEKKEP